MHRRTGILVVVFALGFVGACARQPARGAGEPARGATERSVTGTFSPSSAATPSPSPIAAECPDSGVRITAERGEAAMGYREMSLGLTNCGGVPIQLEGRPVVVVLDRDRNPTGTSIVPSEHYTWPPRSRTLQPQQGVMSMLSWRSTVTAGPDTPVTGVYLSVVPADGKAGQQVGLPIPLDLGTTGRLEVSAWT